MLFSFAFATRAHIRSFVRLWDESYWSESSAPVLARPRVERVHGIKGREEKSCEKFTETPAHAPIPMIAFLANEGHIPLVSLKSRQAVGSLKMNGSVRCAAFSSDGQQVISSVLSDEGVRLMEKDRGGGGCKQT